MSASLLSALASRAADAARARRRWTRTLDELQTTPGAVDSVFIVWARHWLTPEDVLPLLATCTAWRDAGESDWLWRGLSHPMGSPAMLRHHRAGFVVHMRLRHRLRQLWAELLRLHADSQRGQALAPSCIQVPIVHTPEQMRARAEALTAEAEGLEARASLLETEPLFADEGTREGVTMLTARLAEMERLLELQYIMEVTDPARTDGSAGREGSYTRRQRLKLRVPPCLLAAFEALQTSAQAAGSGSGFWRTSSGGGVPPLGDLCFWLRANGTGLQDLDREDLGVSAAGDVAQLSLAVAAAGDDQWHLVVEWREGCEPRYVLLGLSEDETLASAHRHAPPPAPPLPVVSGDGHHGGGLGASAVGLGLTAAAQHRLSSPAAALQPRRLSEHASFPDVLAACVAELRATRDGRRAELDACVFTPLQAYEEWTHWASRGVSEPFI